MDKKVTEAADRFYKNNVDAMRSATVTLFKRETFGLRGYLLPLNQRVIVVRCE